MQNNTIRRTFSYSFNVELNFLNGHCNKNGGNKMARPFTPSKPCDDKFIKTPIPKLQIIHSFSQLC